MENENFEEKLIQMTKPEITQLSHQDILEKAISKAGEKAVLSWWWLLIPLYIILTLFMKSVYMPQSNLVSNLESLKSGQKTLAYTFFLFVPVAIIILNLFSIRKVYLLSGSPKSLNFLGAIWINVVLMFVSIMIFIVYFL